MTSGSSPFCWKKNLEGNVLEMMGAPTAGLADHESVLFHTTVRAAPSKFGVHQPWAAKGAAVKRSAEKKRMVEEYIGNDVRRNDQFSRRRQLKPTRYESEETIAFIVIS